MRHDKTDPSWWQLYLAGLGVIGLLVLGAWAPLSEGGHEAAALGVLLLAGGLVELWLRANTRALLRIDKQIVAQAPQPEGHRQPHLTREVPGAEHLPVPVSWRGPAEAKAEPRSEGAPALQEVRS